MIRGKIISKILELLRDGTETTFGLLDIFTSDYYNSYRKMKQMIKYAPTPLRIDRASKNQRHQMFYSLLNQLKNQGFIKMFILENICLFLFHKNNNHLKFNCPKPKLNF